ncbi:MAG: hypothetical protein HFJ24_03025 [Clostridia bacterium]|nr:hypothetical protein [Clostridia bacterium]MCI9274997.1 hypothetical protein [Clostridia bacterium]
MKKVVIGVVIVLVVAAIIGAIVMFVGKGGNSNTQTGIKVQTVEEMQEVFNTINTKLGEALPGLEVREIELTDEFAFSSTTGLKSNTNVEAVVVSEPFISAQAFSAVMIKVSDEANIEEMKKEILDNVDMRKWICVSAEKLRVTNYGNIIFFVMSDEQWGKPVYDEFKQTVGGKVGQELEKTGEM